MHIYENISYHIIIKIILDAQPKTICYGLMSPSGALISRMGMCIAIFRAGTEALAF